MKEKLFLKLKTEGSSFGLSNDSIKGVADLLSANLTDESNEEEVTNIVKLGLGMMKTMQSNITKEVNRIIPKPKEEEKETVKEVKEEVQDTPAWVNQLIEQNKQLGERLSQLEGTHVRKSRKERLNEHYKGLPDNIKSELLKRVEFIDFKDDEAFANYLETEKPIVESLVKQAGADKVNSLGKIKQGISKENLPPLDEVREILGIKKQEK